jgi:hypothetical protein
MMRKSRRAGPTPLLMSQLSLCLSAAFTGNVCVAACLLLSLCRVRLAGQAERANFVQKPPRRSGTRLRRSNIFAKAGQEALLFTSFALEALQHLRDSCSA